MEACCIHHIRHYACNITVRTRFARRVNDQIGFINRRYTIFDVNGIVRQILSSYSLQLIFPSSILSRGTIGNFIRIRCNASIDVAQEIISQYRILLVSIHQSLRGNCIDGVGIILRLKSCTIRGGYIAHRQIQICRIYSYGSTTGDFIVGRSISGSITSLHFCAGCKVLVLIGTCMSCIIVSFTISIFAISSNSIGNITAIQSIPVHQLALVIRGGPGRHCSITISLSSIITDCQSLLLDF